MRVKFGNHIDLCNRITHSEGSSLLLITNRNGVYTVNIRNVTEAEELFNQALVDGYLDVSDYEYSN